MNAESFCAVVPDRLWPETSAFSQSRHVLIGKLVRGFRMDSLARFDGNAKIRATYTNGHPLVRFEKRVNRTALLVVVHDVPEFSEIEVRVELAIDPCEQVAVESFSHSDAIVVRQFERRAIFPKIGSDKETITRAQRRAEQREQQ